MTSELEHKRIGFVGAGRVAQTLSQAFKRSGLDVRGIWSRQPSHAQSLCERLEGVRPSVSAQAIVDACDLVFLTVSDDALASVCAQLNWTEKHCVVHCSGATEVAALNAAADVGALTGGFHPMQMFANPEVALEGLSGCTIGIEADERLQSHLEVLAMRIGCVPFRLPSGARALYHASAYYVGPFLIALLQEATLLWHTFGANEKEALQALVPLLRGTVSAVLDGGLAGGMGGCVARGDIGTVRAHLKALDEFSASAGALYRQLAVRTVPLGVARGTLSPERAELINSVLGTRSFELLAELNKGEAK